MNPAGMSFQQLLELAAYETNRKKLHKLVLELDKRYQERERNQVNEDRYDIYSGLPDRDAVWLEGATDPASANERLRLLAVAGPGAYFIVHAATRKVITMLNNGPVKISRQSKAAKAAS